MRVKNLKAKLEACDLNLSKLAKRLGVDKSTVSRWAQSRIPAERVGEVSKLTGLSRAELRPDIFGAIESEQA